MTWTIILGALFLAGIGLIIWGIVADYWEWPFFVGTLAMVLAGVALIINLCIWIPSGKNSEIRYNQLLAEKATIEDMLHTDRNVDRLALNHYVINYNNRVIEERTNYNRLIIGDYYNQALDWAGLELIEWR